VTERGQRWASLVALALAFAGLYVRVLTAPPPGGFAPAQTAALAASAAAPRYEAQLLPNSTAASVHSATAAKISGGRLMAFWYGGSREGASDVPCTPPSTLCGKKTGAPSASSSPANSRKGTCKRTVRKLGNPVPAATRRGACASISSACRSAAGRVAP